MEKLNSYLRRSVFAVMLAALPFVVSCVSSAHASTETEKPTAKPNRPKAVRPAQRWPRFQDLRNRDFDVDEPDQILLDTVLGGNSWKNRVPYDSLDIAREFPNNREWPQVYRMELPGIIVGNSSFSNPAFGNSVVTSSDISVYSLEEDPSFYISGESSENYWSDRDVQVGPGGAIIITPQPSSQSKPHYFQDSPNSTKYYIQNPYAGQPAPKQIGIIIPCSPGR